MATPIPADVIALMHDLKTACAITLTHDRDLIVQKVTQWQKTLLFPQRPLRFVDNLSEIKDAMYSYHYEKGESDDPFRDTDSLVNNNHVVLRRFFREYINDNPLISGYQILFTILRRERSLPRGSFTFWGITDSPTVILAARLAGDLTIYDQWIPLIEAAHAGLWLIFPTKNELLLITKPTTVAVNQAGQSHSETGPAFVWNDVVGYYYDGVAVPDYVITRPETITVKTINNEPNTEIRRVMIERYGLDRYMTKNEARCIDQTSINGRNCDLYVLDQMNDEDIHMIKVINATPEQDGTFKEYWLRVPPEIETAMEALAWTFNMGKSEYRFLNFES